MILQQLTLRNFCLYRGEHLLDLSPGRRRNRPAPIVLFGGINGGGKTTLLDAVQLVLYGNRARCSKRADKSYDAFLQDSIHHGVDPGEGAAVQLSFRFASEGEEHLYEVTRSWSVVRERVREQVEVSKDGTADGWLSDNWNTVVEELIPFGIGQLCFFDAEKIRFLADDETSSQALGVAIKSLLGLDLAERLVADTTVLETRIAKRVRKSPELAETERLELELEAKQQEIARLVQDQAAAENPRQGARCRVKEAEEQFAKIGGPLWEEREERQRQRGELDFKLRECEDRLAALAAGELPLMLLTDLLNDVSEQAHREGIAKEGDIIARLLAERDQQLLAVLKDEKIGPEALKRVRKFLVDDLRNRAVDIESDSRLVLSEGSRRSLDHLLQRGLTERCDTAAGLLKELETGRRGLEEIQRSLAATPREDAIRGVAEELKAATAEFAACDQQVNRLEKQLGSLRNERDDIETTLQRLRRKVVDEQISCEEDGRVADLLKRTQAAMQEFLRRATARKIDRLSELITESFRYLLRKKTLVNRLTIDPEKFAITLYDNDGHAIPKQRLSEGEKQIFAISVLWGLSRASARPLPAIIDTPMARLDGEHRNQLVERYFPHASHQVIILSTDTEIENSYFEQLRPSIARAYHLNYDEASKATVATEGYFWDTGLVDQAPEVTV
jgi:DNA sulfur modification protein DndD